MRHVKEYCKPASVQEAVTLLQQHQGKAMCIAGGTHVATLNDPAIEYLVDITYCDLHAIQATTDYLSIGACATLEDLHQSDTVRNFAGGIIGDVARWTGSLQRRNSATVGGSLVLRQDLALPLLALDAQLVLVGKHERIVPLADFYTPTGTVLRAGEILTECRIAGAFKNAFGAVQRQSRTRQDVSIAAVATVVTIAENICQSAAIAVAPVESGITRIPAAERPLQGQPFTPDAIVHAVDAVRQAIHPLNDHRASAEYRRKVLGVYTKRALMQCFDLKKERRT